MAETLLTFGVEKLWRLLVRESERFRGVGEQFNGLKSDVEMLRCFLEDAEAKRQTSAMVRNTIKEIKEIVLDAEDIVKTFLLKKELGNTSGIRNSVRRFSCITLERRGVASDMEAISKRISQVIRNMQSLGVQRVIVSERRKPPQDERRQMFSSVNQEDPLVGMERNVDELVGYLVEAASSEVVSITGMGGLGKTTLARQVFNHERVKSHFPGLAWVCVSQQFSRKEVWQTILQQLRPEIKVLEMTEHVLQGKLVGVLETLGCLFLKCKIKNIIKCVAGWKVLLTSRNEGVALHANRQCFTFKPKCLSFEESWELFQKIVFPMTDTAEFKIDEEMEEMGKKMIKHCGGLPLAIKVLGGLLGKKYILHEWKRIYENIKAHIVGGDNSNLSSVYHVLYLSYEELPVYLKHCFLYLAHFPEDYEIDVEDLSYYWAAEGIPRPRYYVGASIRDVGDGYIEELVKRSMIISERDSITSRFKTCQLHDMMREVCLFKAEEESFLQVQGTSTANFTSRRLAVNRRTKFFDVEMEVKNPRVRILLFMGEVFWTTTSLFFTRLELMRVLDLTRVKFEGGKVPSSIGKLIHLRYLSLRGANVTHLPSSMRNLKQLIYLNLHVHFRNELYMSNFLKEMRELTYLYLPNILHDEVKLELGNLVNLETLENFSPANGSVSDLQGMTRLRTLYIYIESEGCSMGTLSLSLSKLRYLENLVIRKNRLCTPTNDDEEEGFVWDFVHLRKLELSIYMPTLPDDQHFPAHLTTIELLRCRLKEDPMPILEKLMHLKEVRLNDKSFKGRRMVCLRGGFPQLQKLRLCELEEWEEWIVEEGSMPLLHSLLIDSCPKLKELPDGLRFITSLIELKFHKMGEEWKNNLSEGGEDYYKVQHIPSVTFTE